MKLNEWTTLQSSKVHLVPYNVEHVAKYHEWMRSLELQELTASEPLSLEDEYAMQNSWRQDQDKCTFIVLDSELYDKTGNEIESMVGDVNLFIDESDTKSAEIEIMIAERSFRGRGLGTQAILLMLSYGVEQLSIETFTAKIKIKNESSIRLFEKLGFKQVSISDVFQEVHMQMALNSSQLAQLLTRFNVTYTIKQLTQQPNATGR